MSKTDKDISNFYRHSNTVVRWCSYILSGTFGFIIAIVIVVATRPAPQDIIHQAAKFRITHDNGHVYHAHDIQLQNGLVLFRDEASRVHLLIHLSRVVIEDTQ